MKVEIKCSYDEIVDLETLHFATAALKETTEQKIQSLAASLVKYGWRFPMFVWRNDDDERVVIDGLQRYYACELLREQEAAGATKVPVVYVQADDLVQAQRLMLAAASEYARINKTALQEFVNQLKLPDFAQTFEFTDALKEAQKVANAKKKLEKKSKVGEQKSVRKVYELRFTRAELTEFSRLLSLLQVRLQLKPEQLLLTALETKFAAGKEV